MSKTAFVLVGVDREITGQVEANETLTAALLLAFLTQGFEPFCMCCGVPLGYRHTDEDLSVVCIPNSKHLHLPECPRYGRPLQTVIPGDPRQAAAKIKVESGLFFVNIPDKLRLDLRVNRPRTTARAPRRGGVRTRRSPNQTTTLGLLNFLLEEAGLTRHDPEAPAAETWAPHAAKIERLLARGVSRGQPLNDQLLVPHDDNRGHIERALQAIRQSPTDPLHDYRLILGELVGSSRQAHSDDALLALDGHQGSLPVHAEALDQAIRCGGKGLRAALQRLETGDRSSRILMIGRVQTLADGSSRIIDLRMQVTARHWIPVQSGYELDAVNACIAKGVHFWKPVRAVPGLEFIPDLIVDPDSPQWILWEIAGRKGKRYLAHLRTKLVYYGARFPGRYGVWNALAREPMADFSTTVGASLWTAGETP